MMLAISVNIIFTGCQSIPVSDRSSNSGSSKGLTSRPPLIIEGIQSDFTKKEYTDLCDKTLAKAKHVFSELENSQRPATFKLVFTQSDKITDTLQPVMPGWFLQAVHPKDEIRHAASACTVKLSNFFSTISMSRKYYDRVAAIDLTALTDIEKRMVENSLRGFKQSGVDKDAQTREKIKILWQEISEAGSEFSRNIQEDVRLVETNLAALNGLPQDFINSHQPDSK